MQNDLTVNSRKLTLKQRILNCLPIVVTGEHDKIGLCIDMFSLSEILRKTLQPSKQVFAGISFVPSPTLTPSLKAAYSRALKQLFREDKIKIGIKKDFQKWYPEDKQSYTHFSIHWIAWSEPTEIDIKTYYGCDWPYSAKKIYKRSESK